MRDLPGFYFDVVRQRYFPESSCPKPTPSSTPYQHEHLPNLSEAKIRLRKDSTSSNIHASIVQVQRSCSNLMRRQAHHSIVSQRVASSSSKITVHVPIVYSAPITSLCISIDARGKGYRNVSLGDRQGYCYAQTNDAVFAEHCLLSEISSIQSSAQAIVYTSFGPNPQILVRSTSTLESYILRPPQLQDVRSTQLYGSSLTLGMRGKALHITDLENPRQTRSLDTYSDVFALQRYNNDVWAGARSGHVRLFDLRTGQGQNVLGARFADRHVSVINLRRIREYQLLVATLDGSLESFDIRFLQHSTTAVPIQAFGGHHLKIHCLLHSPEPRCIKGFAIDPSEDFLFAAGQDQRVRAWSLRNGHRLEASIRTNLSGLFARTFTHPIHGMQVTSEGHADTLWVACGTELECFELGKSGPPDVA
ncbi:hypothetical protein K439DRAFT_1620276 [Ramaria rubella]|nr:hypothetical protein K439DRAFT_1620276 [Ramaria rubella]